MGRRGKQADILTKPRAFIGGFGTPENPKQIRVHLESEREPFRVHNLILDADEAEVFGNALLELVSELRKLETAR